MGMVAPQQRIASAFVVIFGQHGSVTQYAEERGVCRQWVYREAGWVQKRLADHEEIQRLRQQIRELTKQNVTFEQRLPSQRREFVGLLAVAGCFDSRSAAECADVGPADAGRWQACRGIADGVG